MKIKINRQNNNLKATYNKPKNTVAFRVISDCNRRGGNIHILFWLTPSRPNMKGKSRPRGEKSRPDYKQR